MNSPASKIKSRLRRIPLRVQTTMLIGAIILTSYITVAGVVYWSGLQTLDENVNIAGKQQADIIRKLSIDALIAEDRPALRTTIEGLHDLNLGLISMEIKNFEGLNLVSWRDENLSFDEIVETNQPIEYRGQNFGTLQLQWDRNHFSAPILKRASEMAQVALISLVILGASIVIFVDAYFIRPINYLENKVSAFRAKQFGQIESKEFSSGEIQNLDRNIEDAVAAIQEQALQDKLLSEEREKVKTAEATAAAKSDFLSLMSHEIRTPLGAILGFAELLESPNIDKESRAHVSQIRESGKFLLNIINDILDLSRIEANGLQLESAPFSVNAMIGDTESMTSGLTDNKNVELFFEIDNPDDLNVRGDSHRIQQVLMNLVGNAVKFTNNGSVNVSAKVERAANSIARICYSVKDTGIGMTPAQAESVFTPFSQADDSITRKYGGTGLGVTISSRLIATMGGELKIETQEGIGSEFHFTIDLPVEVVSDFPPKSAAAPSNAKDSKTKGRFLFAEDNLVNQSLFAKLMDNFGHDYVIVNDGQECVDLLKTDTNFDAVLLDVRMPVMDGLTVLELIRSGEIGEKIKSITIASMTADVLSRNEALKKGADEFIMKPICFDELRRFLSSVVEKELASSYPIILDSSRASKPTIEQPVIAFPNIQSSKVDMRIMVADDNASMRSLLDKILLRLGYTASFAKDGVDCLSELSIANFDVLISDFRMPNMDGKTLIHKIRNGEVGDYYRNIPIALITAEKITAAESATAKADLLIPKPIEINSLKRFLENARQNIVNAA
ncbi:MAG: response regulator [Verrucomicrobiales bacterium]